jgi:drug/metabolite transporter (DMT)-like permease
MGYFLVFWSLFSYGALGICHKLAERKDCRPQPLTAMLFLSASLGMNVFILFGKGAGEGYVIPTRPFLVAIIGGSIGICALWAFQEGIKHGKIATSWLIINLSSAIPTIGSIIFYNEPVGLKKILILGLIAAAIVLVWMDRLEDIRRYENEKAENEKVGA